MVILYPIYALLSNFTDIFVALHKNLPEAKQIICAYSQNIYNNQAVLCPFMPSDRMISPLNSLKNPVVQYYRMFYNSFILFI